MLHRSMIAFIAVCVARCLAMAGEPSAKMEAPYVFTDAKAVVQIVDDAQEVACKVRAITAAGWLPEKELKAAVRGGKIEIAPLGEGIHVVSLALDKPAEVRFLAITPPAAINAATLAKALPHNGKKLAAGEKFVILAMGDSVTNTGDYLGMLAMMLSRATGNKSIAAVNRSYSGRSVDAAVRFFKDDAIPTRPDLGLLMYGLNDQAGGVPLDAYLEQYRFIAEHLAADCHADTIFMTPTPHIEIPQDAASAKPGSPPPWFAFRTIGYAESLRPLAAELNVPLADCFQAVWGRGGTTIEDAAKNMWPKFPPSFNDQMKSMLETEGKGDTIHPNALGHLAMARAVLDAIAGKAAPDSSPPPPLSFSGSSKWTDAGVVSRLAAKNVSTALREGKLHVYPLMDSEVQSQSPIAYSLKPGETVEFDAAWPALKRPADMTKHPLNTYIAVGSLRVPVVDFAAGGCRVYAPAAPFEVDVRFVRERKVCDTGTVDVTLLGGNTPRRSTRVRIPAGSEVGRMPLTANSNKEGKTGWAVAEVAYVRYGGAIAGEATVDGDLAEWAGNPWSTVGEPVQARWVQGEVDNRANPQECYQKWAFRAGKAGIFFAVKATGQVQKDRFTIFFDTREPKLLGTAGRYYWVSGSLADNGTIPLGQGETTKDAPGMKGAWKKSDYGAALEFFVPYELMELASWPAANDLGLSIWWVHTGPDGKVTNIMWSEDGHPWNTRWYGVVRLVKDKSEELPYMVRIK